MAEKSAADASTALWQRDFLQRQRLAAAYLESAARWFDPLALRLRDATAVSPHPLLATRGVPGTHDMPLLRRTLNALACVGRGQRRGGIESASEYPRSDNSVAIPRFDKGSDDRAPTAQWDRISQPVDIILLEGWCLGARPVSVVEPPLNALEATEDVDASWRRHINAVLAADFLPLYRKIDLWVMLRAPDVGCVYRWRLEQEQKLALTGSGSGKGTGEGVMSEHQLARFIQHYERLTRHCLATLPARVDILYQLDGSRAVRSVAADLHGPTPLGPDPKRLW